MPPDDHQEVLLLLLIALAEIIMPLMCAYVLPREEFNGPPPANAAYDHMTLVVFLSMAFINLLAITPGSPLCGFPVLSYRDLQMAMLTAFGATSVLIGCHGSGAMWLSAGVLLMAFRLARLCREGTETWEVYVIGLWPFGAHGNPQTAWLRRSPLPGKAVVLRVVQIVLSLGLGAATVLLPWEAATPFFRWAPLNEAVELRCRVMLCVGAVFMLVAASDPWLLNRGISGFLVLCPLLLSCVLLVDNLRGVGGSFSPQHLFGDIMAWFILGLLHLCLGPWSEWLVMSRGYGPVRPRFVIGGEATRLMSQKGATYVEPQGNVGGRVVDKLGNGVFAEKVGSGRPGAMSIRV